MDKILRCNKTSMFGQHFVDKILRCSKTSMLERQFVDKILWRNKTSLFGQHFVDKILLHRENIPETTAIPGETSAAKGKCPVKPHKTGRILIHRKVKLLPGKDFYRL